jgi:uncharacterized protein (DUF433 family)
MSKASGTTYTYLEPRPESAYRQLFIKGTRIRARVLFGLYASSEDPWTPGSIAEQYRLPIEAIREAIAYCESNPPEIEEDCRREEALMDAMGVNDPDYKKTGNTRVLTAEKLARILRH